MDLTSQSQHFDKSFENRNLETLHLFWLDASVNTSPENIKIQLKLRSIINYLQTFDNIHECKNVINSLSKDDRFALIVSGSFGREIIPHIHNLAQLSLIYVYCMNSKGHKEWTSQFDKIRLVTSNFDKIISQIRSDHQRQMIYDEPLSFLISDRSTGAIDGKFLHSQLLIDVLIGMPFSSNAIRELVSYISPTYKENQTDSLVLDEFMQDYSSDKVVWWYSRDSCIYRILNKALRVQDPDILFHYRFFIRDLQKQLQALQCQSRMHVYRGQSISLEEIQMLKKSVGEFISMNSFLSTSIDRQVALSFLPSSSKLQRVLFEIDADPKIITTKPFANIQSLSYFKNEDEVLFMSGSIFQINEVRQDDSGIWIIKLQLSSDQNHNLKVLYKHMRGELCKSSISILSYGNVLRVMGKLDHAEKFYHRYLHELSPDHPDVGNCYYNLGLVTQEQGNYQSSLIWFNKALDIYKTKHDQASIGDVLRSMALVYYCKEDYEEALKFYNEALSIYLPHFGDDHENVGACYDGMGATYGKIKKYRDSLWFKEKAFNIREKHLPADHPDLGQSYTCIGTTYNALGDFMSAIQHFNKSIKIYEKSLPPEHSRFAMTFKNMGITFENMKDFNKAQHYYKKAAEIYHHLFPTDHPDVVDIDAKINEISKYLSSSIDKTKV